MRKNTSPAIPGAERRGKIYALFIWILLHLSDPGLTGELIQKSLAFVK